MHSLSSTFTVDSKLYPGAVYKIRTLNTIQRAKRDAAIASHRLEYTRLNAERQTIYKHLAGDTGTDEEKLERVNAHPVEKRLPILDFDQKAQCILDEHIVPATIRAALISVDGIEIDGAKPTVETLLENAPDGMLTEIYAACVNGSGLTEGEAKN